MNEEELKKGCGVGFWYRDIQFVYCGYKLFLCPTCQARLEGFQKGKLEQKKEEYAFLNGVLKLPEVWGFVIARLKQLQKEIGEEKGK